MAPPAQARAGLLPQAGLAAAASWARREVNNGGFGGTNDSQSTTLSASQPLYRPVNKLNYDQAQLSIDIAKAQLVQAEQDLIVRTTQAYFDVLAAQDTLTFVQAQKTAVAEQLAAAQRNFEVGTATVTDAREAQARFDLVVAQEIAAENDLRVKKLALDQLVGRSNTAPRPLVLPVSLPPLNPADPQAWLNMAGEQHPSIVQARRNLEIAQLETGKAEAGHKPTVDLVASYGTSRAPSSIQGVPGNVRTNTGSVGVQFNLPLFAGFSRKATQLCALVFLLAFGASTLDHELRVHVRELADRNAAIDEISREIDRRFRAQGQVGIEHRHAHSLQSRTILRQSGSSSAVG